jgi:cell division protein FtsQ
MSRRAAGRRRGMPAVAGVRAPSDRRYRRPDVRPGRRRLGYRLRRIVKLVGISVGAVAAVLWLGGSVLRSSWLDVDRIQVRGNTWLSTGEVEALMSGIRGRNILRVDLDDYRRRILDSPWVATATLWRTLPSTIDVQVVERVPMAVARLDRQLYLVDEAGVIIDEFGPEHREFDLPVVDGLVSAPGPGQSIVHPDRVRLTSRFLNALRVRPDLERRISQIDVSNARDVVALLDVDPVFLHLGDQGFVERIETYLQFAPTLRDQFTEIDYVDLRFDEFVYVGSAGRRAVARPGADDEIPEPPSQEPDDAGSPVEGRNGT